MKLLLILAIVALAIAPLLHFVPSQRQRRITAMREQAALGGLFVEFRSLPVVGNSDQLPQPPKGSVIYYGRRLPPPKGRAERRGSWLRRGDHWQGDQPGSELPEVLSEIPDYVLAASLEDGSCGVYWQEQGDVQEVDEIIALVKAWAGAIIERPN